MHCRLVAGTINEDQRIAKINLRFGTASSTDESTTLVANLHYLKNVHRKMQCGRGSPWGSLHPGSSYEVTKRMLARGFNPVKSRSSRCSRCNR